MLLDDALMDDFFIPAQLELRQESERSITFMFEPLRSLPTTIAAVVVRDAAGSKTRLPLATKPALDYYFGIEIFNDDVSALAMHWRTNLQVGAQIDMREAIADELLVQHPPIITEVERPKDPPPDLELWSALGEGVLMNSILKDFYARVYADSQLQPFFSGFTQQRLIEKQYSFMQQLMTGNKVYFGNRPRNTHHWMVISDELFAHREQLMLESMRSHGLAEKWIVRWLAIENYYRTDIVKTHPFPRQINGIDLPLEGFDTLVLDVGAICDGCGGSIEPGETVRYHVRLGTVFCSSCGSL
jgi:truncated hemoglobin YjbI